MPVFFQGLVVIFGRNNDEINYQKGLDRFQELTVIVNKQNTLAHGLTLIPAEMSWLYHLFYHHFKGRCALVPLADQNSIFWR